MKFFTFLLFVGMFLISCAAFIAGLTPGLVITGIMLVVVSAIVLIAYDS